MQMLRGLCRCAIGGSIFAALCAFSVLVGLAASPAPSVTGAAPAASPVASSPPLTSGDAVRLSLDIWVSAALALIIIAGIFFWSRRGAKDASTTEGDLESTRIVYGFWLIIGSLILTLAVVIVTVNIFRPPDVHTADVLAVITSVTGVIGTLIAAFFGVQAAGAGRSQALTALSKWQSQAQPVATQSKLDPGFGPHDGNTRITITGNGFNGATTVNFGTVPGINYQFVNDGLLRVTTPPAPQGKNTADVMVVFDGMTPPNTKVGTFYYYTVAPSHGNVGTQVVITGSGFTNATGVCFAKTPGGNFSQDNAGNLHATVPARPAGVNAGDEVDVTVLFPVDTPTNTVTVGSFTYDN